MSGPVVRALTLASAVGTGVSGGIFFAFSTFVMPALARVPAATGLSAMQAINRVAPGPWFLGLWLGSALTGTVAGVDGLRHLDAPDAPWRVAGALGALLVVVLTMAYHVPRNDALALLDPAPAGSVAPWERYLEHWTAWNHVRTAAGTAAAIAFTVAYRRG